MQTLPDDCYANGQMAFISIRAALAKWLILQHRCFQIKRLPKSAMVGGSRANNAVTYCIEFGDRAGTQGRSKCTMLTETAIVAGAMRANATVTYVLKQCEKLGVPDSLGCTSPQGMLINHSLGRKPPPI